MVGFYIGLENLENVLMWSSENGKLPKYFNKKKTVMANLVQYVIIRKDLLTSLSWPVGAVIAQACHATEAVTHLFYQDENTVKYLEDLDNMHKIVLSIPSEKKLISLSSQLVASDVDHKLWIEQPEDIPTCLVTKPYPKEEVQQYFKKLKLFKYETPPKCEPEAKNDDTNS